MTRKEQAIREVILQRVDCLDKIQENTLLSPMEKAFYMGKKEGLMQAHSLVAESLESIEIELNK